MGNGETIFEIGAGEGICNDLINEKELKFRLSNFIEGEECGLVEDDYKASVATLESIATTLEADCVLLRERNIECGIVGQYLVRHQADKEDFVEIR